MSTQTDSEDTALRVARDWLTTNCHCACTDCCTSLADLIRQAIAEETRHKLQVLASAMRKVLPPQQLQELIDTCDPLSAFLRDGFGAEAERLLKPSTKEVTKRNRKLAKPRR